MLCELIVSPEMLVSAYLRRFADVAVLVFRHERLGPYNGSSTISGKRCLSLILGSSVVKRQSMELWPRGVRPPTRPLPQPDSPGRGCADPDTGGQAPRALSRPCSATSHPLECGGSPAS